MNLNDLNSKEIEQLRGLLSLTSQISGANITIGRFVEEYLDYVKLNRSGSYYKNHQLSFGHLLQFHRNASLVLYCYELK